jgi:hypothetical protein
MVKISPKKTKTKVKTRAEVSRKHTDSNNRVVEDASWQEEVPVDFPPVTVDPRLASRVRFGLGGTIQPRKFESLRVDVHLEQAVDPGKEDEAYARMYAWVDARVAELLSDAQGDSE